MMLISYYTLAPKKLFFPSVEKRDRLEGREENGMQGKAGGSGRGEGRKSKEREGGKGEEGRIQNVY